MDLLREFARAVNAVAGSSRIGARDRGMLFIAYHTAARKYGYERASKVLYQVAGEETRNQLSETTNEYMRACEQVRTRFSSTTAMSTLLGVIVEHERLTVFTVERLVNPTPDRECYEYCTLTRARAPLRYLRRVAVHSDVTKVYECLVHCDYVEMLHAFFNYVHYTTLLLHNHCALDGKWRFDTATGTLPPSTADSASFSMSISEHDEQAGDDASSTFTASPPSSNHTVAYVDIKGDPAFEWLAWRWNDMVDLCRDVKLLFSGLWLTLDQFV